MPSCHNNTYPLLSCSEIEELLLEFFRACDISDEEVFRQLKKRRRSRYLPWNHTHETTKAGKAEWLS